MLESFNKLLELFTKLPATLFVALFLAISGILFLPEGIAATLALLDLRTEYRSILGPLWLLLAAILGTKLFVVLRTAFVSRSNRRAREQQLYHLTPEEKGYLLPYIEEQRNTIYVDMSDGVASGLHRKGIIYRASNVFDMVRGVPFNLQPWAREYLNALPSLLDGAEGRPLSPIELRGL